MTGPHRFQSLRGVADEIQMNSLYGNHFIERLENAQRIETVVYATCAQKDTDQFALRICTAASAFLGSSAREESRMRPLFP